MISATKVVSSPGALLSFARRSLFCSMASFVRIAAAVSTAIVCLHLDVISGEFETGTIEDRQRASASPDKFWNLHVRGAAEHETLFGASLAYREALALHADDFRVFRMARVVNHPVRPRNGDDLPRPQDVADVGHLSLCFAGGPLQRASRSGVRVAVPNRCTNSVTGGGRPVCAKMYMPAALEERREGADSAKRNGSFSDTTATLASLCYSYRSRPHVCDPYRVS